MPRFPRNIVLIGARGAGKTTVGRLLARRLGRHFVDTDDLLADWEGLPVGQVLAAYGEPYLRDVEARVVAEVSARGGKVIATGGGVVTRPENVARLSASGICVWLRAPAATLQHRLRADPAGLASRPALAGADPLAEVPALLVAREPLYAAAAAFTCDTDGREPAEVVDACCAWLAAPGRPLDYEA